MSHNLSKDEMRLLAYLHEHATGYDKHHELEAGAILRELGFAADDLRKHASYLAELGLIGIRRLTMLIGPRYELKALWITIKGESFMRELENAPGIAKRITSKTAGVVYDLSRDVIVRVLSDFMSQWVGGSA